MAAMYLCKVLSLAELSASLPTAGGGYSFARRALGPWGGYLTGIAILLEYALAPAAIAIFIGGYVNSLVGIDGWMVYLGSYLVFVGIHLWGAGEALKTMFVITALAVLAIGVFVAGMLPHFDASNLFDIAVDAGAAGASSFLPEGYLGVWAAFPFAIWFFLAVEGVPLAAEEASNPARDMPRGIITAMVVLLVFAGLVLVLAPGGAGADFMKDHGAPLVGALQAVYGEDSLAATFVNWVGLCGLIASFFSIIYAYSRQVFALSRAGYLPRVLSVTNRRKVPVLALVVPGLIGFCLSLTGQGDPDADHGRFRCHHFLCPDDALAHGPAPHGAGSGAAVPHPRGRHNFGSRLRAGHRGIHLDVPGESGGGHLERGLLPADDRLFLLLQPASPGGQCAGGGIRGHRAGGAGNQVIMGSEYICQMYSDPIIQQMYSDPIITFCAWTHEMTKGTP